MLPEDPILLPEIIDHVFLVAVHPASGREYEEAQSVGHSLRLLGEQPLAPTLFRRFANLGRFVAPYGVSEPDRGNDKPRSMLRRMRRPGVVRVEPASQILRQADVVLPRVLLGLKEIDDVAAVHARGTCKAPAVAKAMSTVAKALADQP